VTTRAFALRDDTADLFFSPLKTPPRGPQVLWTIRIRFFLGGAIRLYLGAEALAQGASRVAHALEVDSLVIGISVPVLPGARKNSS
jgi:Ca2+/Na+ antiporter